MRRAFRVIGYVLVGVSLFGIAGSAIEVEMGDLSANIWILAYGVPLVLGWWLLEKTDKKKE